MTETEKIKPKRKRKRPNRPKSSYTVREDSNLEGPTKQLRLEYGEELLTDDDDLEKVYENLQKRLLNGNFLSFR